MRRKRTHEQGGWPMLKGIWMKLGGPLVALVLLGALPMQSSQAEEAPSRNEAPASNSSAEVGNNPAGAGTISANPNTIPRLGTRADAKDRGTDIKGPARPAGRKESITGSNPIDNPVDMWPGRSFARPHKLGDVKVIVKPASDFRALNQQAIRSAIRAGSRNALGLLVPAPALVQSPNTAQGPQPAAMNGVATSRVGSPGILGATLASQGAQPGTTAMNHGSINGTGLTHPGRGPATVRGAANTTAAGTISGTNIRPRR